MGSSRSHDASILVHLCIFIVFSLTLGHAPSFYAAPAPSFAAAPAPSFAAAPAALFAAALLLRFLLLLSSLLPLCCSPVSAGSNVAAPSFLQPP